jgi:hypothetical protein
MARWAASTSRIDMAITVSSEYCQGRVNSESRSRPTASPTESPSSEREAALSRSSCVGVTAVILAQNSPLQRAPAAGELSRVCAPV